MKFKSLLIAALAGLILSSCTVSMRKTAVKTKSDNGLHKGWNKNTNNPHNPNTTNPGHTKSKAKKSK